MQWKIGCSQGAAVHRLRYERRYKSVLLLLERCRGVGQEQGSGLRVGKYFQLLVHEYKS
jgi:hypothetical protein